MDDRRKPEPMILICPSCGGRHIDVGIFATKPHHTHACQHCGIVWRPALFDTVGVAFLPGFLDEGLDSNAASPAVQAVHEYLKKHLSFQFTSGPNSGGLVELSLVLGDDIITGTSISQKLLDRLKGGR